MANITSCCNCFGNSVSLNNNCGTPTSSGCGDCLQLGHILVGCANSIAPCDTGSTLKIPFDCFCFPCTTPVFKILNEASIQYATVVSIDKTGITIRPDGTGGANSKVSINFFAACDEGTCDVTSDFGSVSIYLKDICEGVPCADGERCNDCSGLCEDITIDLSGQRPSPSGEENTSGFLLN